MKRSQFLAHFIPMEFARNLENKNMHNRLKVFNEDMNWYKIVYNFTPLNISSTYKVQCVYISYILPIYYILCSYRSYFKISYFNIRRMICIWKDGVWK